MRLIKFPGHNVIIAKDQPEYEQLPAYRLSGKDKDSFSMEEMQYMHEGRITCCWKLSFLERLKLLWSGEIWHSILTFGRQLQPQLLEVNRPAHIPEVSNELPS